MNLLETYDYYWNQFAYQPTNNLPLVGSPIYIPFILFSYLYFILKCGPRFMKDREPYSLKTFVKFYNVFQIVANAYVVCRFYQSGLFRTIPVYCRMVDNPRADPPYEVWHTLWLVMLLKLIDLTETVVFVLRKRNNQVTFLHLYHHVTTVVISWFMVKYLPLSISSYTAMLNSMVHVIMYTYYFLSAFGENVQKAIGPYKPYITKIQMGQFILLLAHYTQIFLSDCDPPIVGMCGIYVNIIINFILFYRFYQTRYVNAAKKTS